MRTSLSGSMMDVAAVLNEHKLSWVSVDHVFITGQYGLSCHVELTTIEVLGELAKRLRIGRKQIEVEPYGTEGRTLTVRFKSRGIWWGCKTDAPKSKAELIGIDGESITALPAPKLIALPAPKNKRKPSNQPSLFGGEA
jgi:hypothetical protein